MQSDNNIHRVSLTASKAARGTVVTHRRHTTEECSAGGGGGGGGVVGMRHAGMQRTAAACHVKLKACVGASGWVSLQSDPGPGAQLACVSVCLCENVRPCPG